MSQPWLKFYPSDWRADPALRMCSLMARGLWMEMLCLMHEAIPRGSLLINGNKVTGKQLASLCGASLTDTVRCMGELAGAGVFSTEPDGIIFSRRMRRDEEKSEEGRKQIEKRWGNRKPTDEPNGGPNRSPNQETDAAPITLEARSQMSEARQQVKPESKNINSSEKSWTPPKHGATGKGRIYCEDGTPEFAAYAAEYREVHGVDPVCNKHGGRWFNTLGESPLPVATHHGAVSQ